MPYVFLTLIAVGCSSVGPGSSSQSRGALDATSHSQGIGEASASVVEEQSTADISTPAGTWRYLIPPQPVTKLDRAAALSSERVAAVGDGRLYRLGHDHWVETALPADLEAVDVITAASAFWVLARKRGESRLADVYRWDGGSPSLRMATAVELAEGELSQALQVARDASQIRRVSSRQWRNNRGQLFEIGDDGIVSVDGDRTRSHSPFYGPTKLIGVTADGAPVVLANNRNLYFWRFRRLTTACRPMANGMGSGMLEVNRGAGWQGVTGAVPREVFAVLPMDPPLLVGRFGELSRVRTAMINDGAEPIVAVARPRVSKLVALEDGAVLAISGEELLRIDDEGASPLELDAAGHQMLREINVMSPNSASRIEHLVLRNGPVIIAYKSTMIVFDGSRVTAVNAAAAAGPRSNMEVIGLVEVAKGYVALGHSGQVLSSLDGGALRMIGSLSDVDGPDVPHPVGAFAGPDGRARLVDFNRHIACTDGRTLEICGDVFNVRDYRPVQSLHDCLILGRQGMHTKLATASGVVDEAALRSHFHPLFAGNARSLFALANNGVYHLAGDEWQLVAGVPDGLMAQSIARRSEGGGILIGAEGGVVLEFTPSSHM